MKIEKSNKTKTIVCKTYINDFDDAILMLKSLIKNNFWEKFNITFIVPGKDQKIFRSQIPRTVEVIEEESLYSIREIKWLHDGNNNGLGWITQQVSKLKYGALKEHELLYFIDSDTLVFKENFGDLAEDELKVFSQDNQCTVDRDGRIRKPLENVKIEAIGWSKKDNWNNVAREIKQSKGWKENSVSWRTKYDIIKLFSRTPTYFNPMPLPVISGKYIKSLQVTANKYDLSLIELIDYCPHEYYWVFLNAANEGNKFNYGDPHAIHVNNRENLFRFWKGLLKGYKLPERTHALVLAQKKMILNLSIRKDLSLFLQDMI